MTILTNIDSNKCTYSDPKEFKLNIQNVGALLEFPYS